MSHLCDVNDIEELLALMEHWGIGEMHLTIQDASVDLVRVSPPASGMAVQPPRRSIGGRTTGSAGPELQCTPELLDDLSPRQWASFTWPSHHFPHGVPAGRRSGAGRANHRRHRIDACSQ